MPQSLGDQAEKLDYESRASTLERAIGDVLTRVFDESGLPERGPWRVTCDVVADLDARAVTMHLELELRDDLSPANDDAVDGEHFVSLTLH